MCLLFVSQTMLKSIALSSPCHNLLMDDVGVILYILDLIPQSGRILVLLYARMKIYRYTVNAAHSTATPMSLWDDVLLVHMLKSQNYREAFPVVCCLPQLPAVLRVQLWKLTADVLPQFQLFGMHEQLGCVGGADDILRVCWRWGELQSESKLISKLRASVTEMENSF